MKCPTFGVQPMPSVSIVHNMGIAGMDDATITTNSHQEGYSTASPLLTSLYPTTSSCLRRLRCRLSTPPADAPFSRSNGSTTTKCLGLSAETHPITWTATTMPSQAIQTNVSAAVVPSYVGHGPGGNIAVRYVIPFLFPPLTDPKVLQPCRNIQPALPPVEDRHLRSCTP